MTTALQMMALEGKERRQHKRHPVHQDAVVFLGKETGSIIDMSMGGLAIHFVSMRRSVSFPEQIDLFVAQTGFYLPNLPVMVVNEIVTPPRSIFSSLLRRRLCLQFGPLSNEQQSRLQRFLALDSTTTTH